MNASEKYIKNSIACGHSSSGNTPQQYGDRQRQYLSERTKLFADKRAYLASDYINAEAQGLLQDFYAWTNTNIRLSDVVGARTDSMRRQDDFKEVLFPDYDIDYFPLGAKIKAMGSVWLSINPSNISSVNATSIVARCNASYNSYDYYGNIITEPIVVEKTAMLNNDTTKGENLMLMSGYFNITAQLNDNTRKLSQNKRIILGTNAYYVTGFTDFVQEFSGDRDSCHVLNFTARLEEVTENDDMENFVAGGKAYTYEVEALGNPNLIVGQTTTIHAVFKRGGEVMQSTDEKPISFKYISSDENIARVDENGNVTTYNSGNVTITAILDQNTNLKAYIELVVEELVKEPYVAFVGLIPTTITQYSKATYNAKYIELGMETQEPLKWRLSGARKENYNYTVSEDGQSIEVECISPSDRPLKITAKYGDLTAFVKVELEGY